MAKKTSKVTPHRTKSDHRNRLKKYLDIAFPFGQGVEKVVRPL
jgi:hypothetical protein